MQGTTKKYRDLNYDFNSYRPHYIKNIRIALPIMLSQLGNAIVMFTDNIMVGRVGDGTNELAAVSFGNALFIVGFVLVQGVGFGATPLIGEYYSAGKHRKATELFANSIIVNIAAFLVFGFLMWQVHHLMPYMGQDEAVWKLATPYYLALVVSLFPYTIFLAFKQYLEGMGNTRYAMNITLMCCFVNVLFNYLLIFGKCGFPELGVFGAGVSTLIARTLMPILYIALFRYKNSLWRHLYFVKRKSLSWNKMKKLGKVGLPIGGQMSVECLAFSISAVMAGWFGAVALASHEIAMSMSSLTFMVVTGISSATTVCVAHQKGLNSKLGIRKAGNAAIQMGIFYSLACASTMILTSTLVPRLFSENQQVLALSATLLIFAAVYQIPDGMQAITIGALRGIADVKTPMWSCIIGYMFVNLPVSYLISVKLGVGITGIWMGFIIGLATVSAIAVVRWFMKSKI